MIEESLSQYQEFLHKVDQKFSEISTKHASSFQCKMGCHSCCKPDLTINPLEHANIQKFLETNPLIAQKIKNLAPQKNRCSMLDENGACSIYEARPIVCRTHGAPLQFKDPSSKEENRFRDVCPLNFDGKNIGELEANDVMNLDTINTLLALITQRAFGKKQERFPLKATSFKI